MEKCYVVYTKNGWHEGYETKFVTTSKEKAEKWVEKYNSMLKRWKECYSKYSIALFETKIMFFNAEKYGYGEYPYERWSIINELQGAGYYETKLIK